MLSSLYQYKTHPLTADWLQVCFGSRSDTAVKSAFQKSLSARLRSGRPAVIAETLINPLFTDVAFRRDSEGDGSGHYESGEVMSPPSLVPSARLVEWNIIRISLPFRCLLSYFFHSNLKHVKMYFT